MVSRRFLEGVRRVSVGYLEGVWRGSERCLEGVFQCISKYQIVLKSNKTGMG